MRYEDLHDLASRELELIRRTLPLASEEKVLLLLEIQRYFDAASLSEGIRDTEISIRQHNDVMRWGMNLATSELLESISMPNGIPMVKASREFRDAAGLLLYKLGVVSLLRRMAEMVRVGFLKLSNVDGVWIFRGQGHFKHQFLDEMEPGKLEKNFLLRDHLEKTDQGWSLFDLEDFEVVSNQIGAFSSRMPEVREPSMSGESLNKLMLSLMRPWKTPYGTFLAYDADERVDEDFFVIAGRRLVEASMQAGIHPSVEFLGFSATELFAVCVVLVMVYSKHVSHCLVASQTMPEVDVSISLTLWQRKSEMVDAICDATSYERKKVELIIKYLSVYPSDARVLSGESVPILPMIIDLGNGMVLRPISSMTQNQLVTFLSISQWRDAQSTNRISKFREPWFREQLYGIFRGTRYVRVEGSIVIRDGRRKLTDIDAAILDRTTGQLALFQLKWQDYFSNSVKQLGSRAKNFSSEVDAWAEALHDWIVRSDALTVMQTFKLDPKKREVPTKIYLFALSWRVARTAGYGFPVTNPLLSVASWPQFCRVRLEIGPDENVLDRIHEVLRNEESGAQVEFTPIPYEICLSQGERMVLQDLWNCPTEQLEGQTSTRCK